MTVILLGLQLVAMQNPAATTFRGSAQLPGSVDSFSSAIGLDSGDSSTLLLRTIRLAYGQSDSHAQRARAALARYLDTAEVGRDVVPLPLNPELWTDVILQTRIDQRALVSAILRDRGAALVYYGLSALDDETLQWIATNRSTLVHIRKYPEIFAAFGRSLRIHDGRVIVPGGPDAESLWRSVIGLDPARADTFVQRVIAGDGRLAFLYDVIAHLDDAHRRFALGLQFSDASRDARLRSLLAIFNTAAPEWRVIERPFARPPLDGAILLSTMSVTATGYAVPPLTRRLWDRVFRADGLNDVRYEEISDAEVRAVSRSLVLDAPWLGDRILRVPYAIGRRRLDTLLFGQRVFHAVADPESADVATALRGYLSFPALMIALERMRITDPHVYVRAAEHAARLNGIQSSSQRRMAIAQFQSAIALILRMKRVREITVERATSLVTSLTDLEIASRLPYSSAFVNWLREKFLVELPKRATLEESLVAAVAGVPSDFGQFPIVEWEGRRYFVNPAAGEFTRIRAIRQAQHEPTLDTALSSDDGQMLADALVSMVYAIHLGDPEGAAVTSSSVALRHDFGLPLSPSGGPSDAWHLPIERFDGKEAWRIRGSLLGLEAALSRLVLRRIDRTTMPGEPMLGSQDRQTVMLTAALANPADISDQSRDDIAAAIARGRARVAALVADPSKLDEVVATAGVSEWRRQALAWSLAQARDAIPGVTTAVPGVRPSVPGVRPSVPGVRPSVPGVRPLVPGVRPRVPTLSLLELFWLGTSPGDAPGVFDGWGAAALRLTGCLCLQLPRASPWEDLSGYATEVLATRGADVPLKIAETLATLNLPAALAPALAGFVTQDVIDHARLAYPDDWEAFSRAVLELPDQRISDYVAALTVAGPLIEIR